MTWLKNHFWIVASIVSIGLTLAAFNWWLDPVDVGWVLHDRRAALYGTGAALFGALLGFSITAAGIFLSIGRQGAMSVVAGTTHYGRLASIFAHSTAALSVATLACIVALLWDQECATCQRYWLTVTVAVTSVWAAVSVACVAWVVRLILGLAAKKSDAQGT